jgi:hypothetical protein
MKRIILLATVAALMAVMSVVGAPAAFAHADVCTGKGSALYRPGASVDRDGDNVICQHTTKSGKVVYTDDHGYEPV